MSAPSPSRVALIGVIILPRPHGSTLDDFAQDDFVMLSAGRA
jgi:hypothetical protein